MDKKKSEGSPLVESQWLIPREPHFHRPQIGDYCVVVWIQQKKWGNIWNVVYSKIYSKIIYLEWHGLILVLGKYLENICIWYGYGNWKVRSNKFKSWHDIWAYVLLLSIYLWRFGVGYGDTNAWNVPQASLKHSRVAFPNTKLRNCEVEGLFELHDHASLEPQQILWRLCLAQSYQEQTSVRMTRMTKSWAFHGVHTLPLPKADSLIRWIFWFISYSHGKWPIYRWFTY